MMCTIDARPGVFGRDRGVVCRRVDMLLQKRMKIVVFVILSLALLVPMIVHALSDITVINFGNYEKRITAEFQSISTNSKPKNPDGSPNYILTPSVMAISNWIVEVRSSGVRIPNIVKSQCLSVFSKLQNQNVLGVRINFPETRQNDRAYIRPQFEFHVYDKKGNFSNISNGIVTNVGLVKDVSVWVKGRNYPFDFAVRMLDQDNKAHEYFFGNLFFDNWRKLTWVNPNYIDQVKDRVIIRKPMYPKDLPYLKFSSFVVYRNMDQIGGDFILYIKNVSMRYEWHAAKVIENDIDDEEVWKILQQRAIDNMQREQKGLAEKAHDLKQNLKLQQEGNVQ